MKKILFVCTANTCRSFMAEHLMKQLLKEEEFSGSIEVASAGVLALAALRPPDNALRVLKEAGIEPGNHQARKLDRDLVEEADFVLAMERTYRDRILREYPTSKGKVFLLKEFAGLGEEDILDPIGCSYEAYETCLSKIKAALMGIIKRLKGD